MMQVTLLSDFGRLSSSPEEIVCHAASVSRNSVKKRNLDQMRKFNSKIIKVSGHKSVMEHAHYVFKLDGISRLLAERIGEHRLLSITEQSQRYVDMSNVEFVEGNVFLNLACLELYREMVENGIPLEDARYVLPLSTPTTMVISGNARTMEYLCNSLIMSLVDEFSVCGREILKELVNISPSLFSNNVDVERKFVGLCGMKKLATVNNFKVDDNESREKMFWHIMAAKHGLDLDEGHLDFDKASKEFIVTQLFMSNGGVPGREMEAIDLSFLVFGSSVMYNQLKRHRMMTVLPDDYCVEHIVTPILVQHNEKMLQKYKDIISKSQELFNTANQSEEKRYYLLNGHCRQIFVKMNGRQLFNFYKLRGNDKAQLEIRTIAENMRSHAKTSHPIIFKYL